MFIPYTAEMFGVIVTQHYCGFSLLIQSYKHWVEFCSKVSLLFLISPELWVSLCSGFSKILVLDKCRDLFHTAISRMNVNVQYLSYVYYFSKGIKLKIYS